MSKDSRQTVKDAQSTRDHYSDVCNKFLVLQSFNQANVIRPKSCPRPSNYYYFASLSTPESLVSARNAMAWLPLLSIWVDLFQQFCLSVVHCVMVTKTTTILFVPLCACMHMALVVLLSIPGYGRGSDKYVHYRDFPYHFIVIIITIANTIVY